ncbi:MAG: hypothetical protein V3U84_00185, partial [Thiotrichaceae bacterium]
KYKIANPNTWPDQANLAANNRWPALKALQDILIGGVYPDASKANSKDKNQTQRISELEKELLKYKEPKNIDIDAAKAAGFTLRGSGSARQHDFTIIEGIGPKINELIHDAGIHTYADLGETETSIIQKILNDAGSNFKLAEPDTWSEQSAMAANDDWSKLKKWQDELDGGKA